MNISLIGIATVSLAALSMNVLWQIEKNNTITLEGNLNVLTIKFEQQKTENLKLKNALNESQNTSAKNIALVKKNAKRMRGYGDKLLLAEKENNQLSTQINNLRISEVNNAIKNPYQRGNAAATRWAHIMQRIAKVTSTNRKGANYTDTAARNPSGEGHTTKTH